MEGSIVSGQFPNKVAVVTGGSRGIGREIAADLARAGAQTVIVCARSMAVSTCSTASRIDLIAATYWFVQLALPARAISPSCRIRLG
ncbi:MAG TPA: SDR family NAD(P)-dependent oxidoreductase [Xanthobacteraceae bacterium]|nr:SDR family NAD(P)-dependent oxidoreductase [Xanthobacteraceae bacterium]